MAYRAFWLDITTGNAIELGRGVNVEVHVQYVLQHPGTFGFTGKAAEQMERMAASGRVPYELSDYPESIVKPLLGRWVKVRIDERYVNFTTVDRPTRKHLEAMQDFMMARRFRQGVFLMGEPSGRILGRFTRPDDFLTVSSPGQLRRVAAKVMDMARRVTASVGQVWRRPDGLEYRVAARSGPGWYLTARKPGSAPDGRFWGVTGRHFHNLVVTERLRLVYRPPVLAAVAERLGAVGLPALARALRVVARQPAKLMDDRLENAADDVLHLEEQLRRAGSDEERERVGKELRDARYVLDTDGPVVRDPDRVASPNHITDDTVSPPNKVTR